MPSDTTARQEPQRLILGLGGAAKRKRAEPVEVATSPLASWNPHRGVAPIRVRRPEVEHQTAHQRSDCQRIAKGPTGGDALDSKTL
jgi:hypothetical protein